MLKNNPQTFSRTLLRPNSAQNNQFGSQSLSFLHKPAFVDYQPTPTLAYNMHSYVSRPKTPLQYKLKRTMLSTFGCTLANVTLSKNRFQLVSPKTGFKLRRKQQQQQIYLRQPKGQENDSRLHKQQNDSRVCRQQNESRVSRLKQSYSQVTLITHKNVASTLNYKIKEKSPFKIGKKPSAFKLRCNQPCTVQKASYVKQAATLKLAKKPITPYLQQNTINKPIQVHPGDLRLKLRSQHQEAQMVSQSEDSKCYYNQLIQKQREASQETNNLYNFPSNISGWARESQQSGTNGLIISQKQSSNPLGKYQQQDNILPQQPAYHQQQQFTADYQGQSQSYKSIVSPQGSLKIVPPSESLCPISIKIIQEAQIQPSPKKQQKEGVQWRQFIVQTRTRREIKQEEKTFTEKVIKKDFVYSCEQQEDDSIEGQQSNKVEENRYGQQNDMGFQREERISQVLYVEQFLQTEQPQQSQQVNQFGQVDQYRQVEQQPNQEQAIQANQQIKQAQSSIANFNTYLQQQPQQTQVVEQTQQVVQQPQKTQLVVQQPQKTQLVVEQPQQPCLMVQQDCQMFEQPCQEVEQAKSESFVRSAVASQLDRYAQQFAYKTAHQPQQQYLTQQSIQAVEQNTYISQKECRNQHQNEAKQDETEDKQDQTEVKLPSKVLMAKTSFQAVIVDDKLTQSILPLTKLQSNHNFGGQIQYVPPERRLQLRDPQLMVTQDWQPLVLEKQKRQMGIEQECQQQIEVKQQCCPSIVIIRKWQPQLQVAQQWYDSMVSDVSLTCSLTFKNKLQNKTSTIQQVSEVQADKELVEVQVDNELVEVQADNELVEVQHNKQLVEVQHNKELVQEYLQMVECEIVDQTCQKVDFCEVKDEQCSGKEELRQGKHECCEIKQQWLQGKDQCCGQKEQILSYRRDSKKDVVKQESKQDADEQENKQSKDLGDALVCQREALQTDTDLQQKKDVQAQVQEYLSQVQKDILDSLL